MGSYIEDRTPLGLPDRIAVLFFSRRTFDPAQACRLLPFDPSTGTLRELCAGDFTIRVN